MLRRHGALLGPGLELREHHKSRHFPGSDLVPSADVSCCHTVLFPDAEGGPAERVLCSQGCSDGGRFCFQPEGCMDTSGSLESKAPYFSHLNLAELGRWHGVSTAGKLCQLHSKETPLLQKCCCMWVSTPAEEDV